MAKKSTKGVITLDFTQAYKNENLGYENIIGTMVPPRLSAWKKLLKKFKNMFHK